MEEAYGTGIVAGPYLLLAYGAGAVFLFGYLAWLLFDRIKIRKLETVMKDQSNG